MHCRALIVLLGVAVGSCLKLKGSSDTFTPSHIIPGGVFKDDNNGSATFEGGELGSGPPGTYGLPYTVPWNNRIDNVNQDFRNGYHPDPRISPYSGPQNIPYRPEYRDPRYGVAPYQPYSDPYIRNNNNYGAAPYEETNGYQGYPQQSYRPQYNTYPDTNDRGYVDRTWYDRTPYRGYDRLITPQGLYSYPGNDNYRKAPVNYLNPNYRTPRRPYPNQGQFYRQDYPFSNTAPIQFSNN